ncbi:MAG: hypothetical protein RL596_318 [Bacteroidota bacterium]
MRMKHILFFYFLSLSLSIQAQRIKDSTNKFIISVDQDSVTAYVDSAKILKKKKDSTWLANHNPRIATKRSAILPGWGQAYNREYWKIPLVYGLLAIPTASFFYNNSYYKKTKFAYEAKVKAAAGDSSDYASIDPELINLSVGSLQNYRNSFRRDRDYSILWFILAWGLQVVDATVFAHLKQFNVSKDLSMQIHPQLNPTTRTPALTLAFQLREGKKTVDRGR